MQVDTFGSKTALVWLTRSGTADQLKSVQAMRVLKNEHKEISTYLCGVISTGQIACLTSKKLWVRVPYPVPLQGATAQICNKFVLFAQYTSMVSVAQRKSAGLWLRRSRFQNSSLTPYAGVAQRSMALVSKTSVREHHVGSNPNHPCHKQAARSVRSQQSGQRPLAV